MVHASLPVSQKLAARDCYETVRLKAFLVLLGVYPKLAKGAFVSRITQGAERKRLRGGFGVAKSLKRGNEMLQVNGKGRRAR